MTRVEELEQAIAALRPEELAQLRAWLTAFDAAAWDRQFESDVQAGRLDALTDEALKELHPAVRRLYGVAIPGMADREDYLAHLVAKYGEDG